MDKHIIIAAAAESQRAAVASVTVEPGPQASSEAAARWGNAQAATRSESRYLPSESQLEERRNTPPNYSHGTVMRSCMCCTSV